MPLPNPLGRLLDHLPFALDAYDEANAAFVRWHEERREADKRIVDLWTYCYVYRYMAAKLIQRPAAQVADLDELVDKVYQKIQAKLGSIRQPDHYAQWVSVVCRHRFLNYLRTQLRKPAHHSLDAEHTPELADPGEVRHDPRLIRRLVLEAIDRLPPYLQKPARLRLIEHVDYEEVAERVGQTVPTTRAYVHKALQRLREDAALRVALENMPAFYDE